MTREEAYEIVKKLIKNENLIKHHLACEAAMKELYRRLTPEKSQNQKDEEKWGIVGLLHDADYELTKNHPEKHTLVLEEKIGNKLDPDVLNAIKYHNFAYTKVESKGLMDYAIYACDELTGLIVAATLVHPDKKLSSVNPTFILNRFAETSFAKGANRDQIKTCEDKLKIPLPEFVDIVLKSMQQIAPDLGF